MRLPRLPGYFLLRRMVRELEGVHAQMTRQGDLLTRLVDQLVPRALAVDDEALTETGLDYVDATDQALLLAFSARTERETGHTPTEEELVTYLADERTHDLHVRLIARDQELARRVSERRR